MARDYSEYQNMFDTPYDHYKEREAIRRFHHQLVARVTQIHIEAGGQQLKHSPRTLKHKGMSVAGRRVK